MSFITFVRTVANGIGTTAMVILALIYMLLLLVTLIALPFLAVGMIIMAFVEKSILIFLLGLWLLVMVLFGLSGFIGKDTPKKEADTPADQ